MMESIGEVQIVRKIASGNFGTVFEGYIQNRRNKVAVKQIRVCQKTASIRQACRELKIISEVKHSNVVKMLNAFMSGEFLWITTELYLTDLSKLLKLDALYNRLGIDGILRISYEIVCGLQYLHSMKILHRDMKPSNVMIDHNLSAKIGDFGSSRLYECSERPMTEYVVTRWYRAPEIICSVGQYGPQIDVWATGCIIAELLSRKPLLPGRSSMDQMHILFRIFGTPSPEDAAFIVDDEAVSWLKTVIPQEGIGISEAIPTTFSTVAVRQKLLPIIADMMKFNPKKRITMATVSRLEVFQSFRCIDDHDQDQIPEDVQLSLDATTVLARVESCRNKSRLSAILSAAALKVSRNPAVVSLHNSRETTEQTCEGDNHPPAHVQIKPQMTAILSRKGPMASPMYKLIVKQITSASLHLNRSLESPHDVLECPTDLTLNTAVTKVTPKAVKGWSTSLISSASAKVYSDIAAI